MKHALRLLALPIALVAGCLLAGTAAAAPPTIGPLDYTAVRSSVPWWSVPNAGGAIELYGSRLSATPGQRVDLFVNSVGGVRYELRLWRLDGSLGGATRLIPLVNRPSLPCAAGSPISEHPSISMRNPTQSGQ